MRYGIFWLLGKCTHRCGHLSSKRIVFSADLEMYPDHNLCFPRPDQKATTALDQEIGGLNLRDSLSYTSRQRRGLRTLSLFMALEEAVSPRGRKTEIIIPSGQRNFFPPNRVLENKDIELRIHSFLYIFKCIKKNEHHRFRKESSGRSRVIWA